MTTLKAYCVKRVDSQNRPMLFWRVEPDNGKPLYYVTTTQRMFGEFTIMQFTSSAFDMPVQLAPVYHTHCGEAESWDNHHTLLQMYLCHQHKGVNVEVTADNPEVIDQPPASTRIREQKPLLSGYLNNPLLQKRSA